LLQIELQEQFPVIFKATQPLDLSEIIDSQWLIGCLDDDGQHVAVLHSSCRSRGARQAGGAATDAKRSKRRKSPPSPSQGGLLEDTAFKAADSIIKLTLRIFFFGGLLMLIS
jgi:hypothetical protein